MGLVLEMILIKFMWFRYLLISFIICCSSTKLLATSIKQNINGELNLKSTSYTTQITDEAKLNRSYHYSLNLSHNWSGDIFNGGGKLVGGHFSELNQSYLVVPELFGSTIFITRNTKITLGRKLNSWSQIDNYWQTSFWQPQFNTDPLIPIQQGLTGINFEWSEKNRFKGGLFYSSFFMPNMGSKINSKNGRLEVFNRWILSPSREFPLQGKSTQIMYTLDQPSVLKIINQKTIALYSQFGDEELGPHISLSWAHKPINELVLSFNGRLLLDEADTFGDVVILPHVVSHEISSADLSYSWEHSKFIFSFLKDNPENLIVPYSWNMQNLEKINALSARYDLFLSKISKWRGEVGISRLIINGGRIFEFESDGSRGNTLSGFRVPFTDAWSLDYKGPFLGFSRNFMTTEFRFLRDFSQKGSMLNAEVQIKPVKDWNFSLGADVIGVQDNSEKNSSKAFLNQYRANDRIYAGAGYVF